MNPRYIAILWALSILMVGAVALGPVFIFWVAGAAIVVTTVGVIL